MVADTTEELTDMLDVLLIDHQMIVDRGKETEHVRLHIEQRKRALDAGAKATTVTKIGQMIEEKALTQNRQSAKI